MNILNKAKDTHTHTHPFQRASIIYCVEKKLMSSPNWIHPFPRAYFPSLPLYQRLHLRLISTFYKDHTRLCTPRWPDKCPQSGWLGGCHPISPVTSWPSHRSPPTFQAQVKAQLPFEEMFPAILALTGHPVFTTLHLWFWPQSLGTDYNVSYILMLFHVLLLLLPTKPLDSWEEEWCLVILLGSRWPLVWFRA